jgi:Rrf2 family protein
MDVLRRNTDYGLRIMASLARHCDKDLVSAKQLAVEGNFSYELGCKILQKLHKAGLVKSSMGPKGGFALTKKPSEITLMEIIRVLQAGIRLNRCLPNGNGCEFQPDCQVHKKLAALQLHIDEYLGAATLAETLKNTK